MRNRFVIILLALTLISGCGRRIVIERINSNGVHVRTIKAQKYKDTILEKDLYNGKEVILSDEKKTGIVIRMKRDSSGSINVETFVPEQKVVVRDSTKEENLKSSPRKRVRLVDYFKGLLIIIISIAVSFLGFFFYKKYKDKIKTYFKS